MVSLNQAKKHYSKDFIDLVESHFEKLSFHYRIPIFLLIQENLTINEISEILDLPVGSIRTKIYSGLNKIKNTLHKEGVTASLDLIWNLIENIEKAKTPENVVGMTYFQSIKLLASQLSNSISAQGQAGIQLDSPKETQTGKSQRLIYRQI